MQRPTAEVLLGLHTGAALGTVAPRADPVALQRMFGVLSAHADALKRLQSVLQRDDRDLAVLATEQGGPATSAAKGSGSHALIVLPEL